MSAVPRGEPVYLTYQRVEESDSALCQGDLIQPSDEVRELLSEVHPHFVDDKYVAFLIVTQTCDLVRRDQGLCKSRYVTLAVVRPLKDVLPAFLDRACERAKVGSNAFEGVYIAESKSRAVQLLERILNQNAQAEGLFYLHKDRGVGIAVPSVALLQVTFAVRAHEHYDRLVRSRTGRLKEQFQSKLGWLLGNLFSRVATEDMPAPQRKEILSAFLDAQDDSDETAPRWVPRANIREASKVGVDVAGLTRVRIAALLESHQPRSPKDIAVERVLACLRDVFPGISEKQITQVRNRLANDAVFRSVCK